MRTCKVCRFTFHESRDHCPVCGTYPANGYIKEFRPTFRGIMQVTAARGCERQRPSYQGHGPRLILVDGN